MAELLAYPDSFKDQEEPKSSKAVWDALCDAEREIEPYRNFCDRIDRIIDAGGNLARGQSAYYSDQEFDLFWASLEILKPAVYSRAPKPVVAPRFQDRNKTATTASEMLERCLISSFERGDFDQVMLNARDDLVISGRGVVRITYETDEKGGGKRVCEEHVDRCDFLTDGARKWAEVGWVAFAGYLTEREFTKRFPKTDPKKAQFNIRRDRSDDALNDTTAKCKVWEVWHKADNRVYWVTEGVDVFLDESAPFLELEGFFPCPRPAYGVLKRRSLVPVPDYVRYERTLEQVNELTRRIHALLEWIRVKGLIPAGGEVGQAVETALTQTADNVLLIPIPSAALTQGTGQFVQFLPIDVFATTIQGLIEARRELIQNFYELSGISDIMRGATEAEETLGAQQLKSQYGSVRVREKIDELQRIARDVARISAEIIAEKFDQKTLLDMSQMTIPTKAEIAGDLKQLEASAKKELDDLGEKAKEMAQQAKGSGQQIDPQQAQQQFQQQQQAILAKYQPEIERLNQLVPIEDVMKLLRDQKARGFTIEIETDSTIMVDEMAEKQSRAEFLTAFANATAATQSLLMAGESGAKLAGGMIKFALGPFRAGRELDGLIDDFVEKAPAALAQQQGQQGDDQAQQAVAEANKKLADAEMVKAQAKVTETQGKLAQANADNQRKFLELQQKGAIEADKHQRETEKLNQQLRDMAGRETLMQAQVDNLTANTAKILASIGLDERKQQLSEYTAARDTQAQQVDQAMAVQDQQHSAAMDDRQQGHAEQQAERADNRADRQQDYAERSGDRQQAFAERQAAKEPV